MIALIMKNRLSAILMAFFASVSLNALSFSEIRALGKAGEEVALSGVLEGLVVRLPLDQH